jgi:hypothetical protein
MLKRLFRRIAVTKLAVIAFILVVSPIMAFAQEETGNGAGLNLDTEVIANIVTLVLAVLAGLFGKGYAGAKGKANAWAQFAQNKSSQFNALVAEIASAAADDKLTKEEGARIVSRFKALTGRETAPPPA